MKRFKRDSKGLAEILKSAEVADAVHDKAEQVAGLVSASFGPARNGIVVDDYETDRAASSVTIRDVRALPSQAKHGTLTRAATAVGLEIGTRGRQ